jgi:hypothetical protein
MFATIRDPVEFFQIEMTSTPLNGNTDVVINTNTFTVNCPLSTTSTSTFPTINTTGNATVGGGLSVLGAKPGGNAPTVQGVYSGTDTLNSAIEIASAPTGLAFIDFTGTGVDNNWFH